MKIKNTIVYYGYAVAWKIIRLLPESIAYRLSRRAATYLYKRNGKGVHRLRRNYSIVHPEYLAAQLEDLVRRGLVSYTRYWIDTFRLPSWSREMILSRVEVVNQHYLTDPMDEGRGVIVSLPHAGNWDHAGAYFSAMGYPVVSVAEHLEPEKLFRKFLAYRQEIGLEILDLNSRAIGQLSQRLRSGKLVALLGDRDLSRTAAEVRFFNQRARMPVGPAILSIQTGAPLITAFVSYTPTKLKIEFLPAIPVPSTGSNQEKILQMIQETAYRFESAIKVKTEDWHMLQRVFLDQDFFDKELSESGQ